MVGLNVYLTVFIVFCLLYIVFSGKRSSVLLKTSIPVIPIDKCRRIYSNSASLTDHQICAGGYYGSDSCAGDSGGPLKYISKVGFAESLADCDEKV